MWNVLKGVLTRRMFFLFLAIGLLPTLIVTIAPALVRIQESQKTAQQLDKDLRQRTGQTFGDLVNEKASGLGQSLQLYARTATLLADTAGDSPANSEALYQRAMGADPIVASGFIHFENSPEQIFGIDPNRGSNSTGLHGELASMLAQQPDSRQVRWKVSYLSMGPILTVAAPIWSNGKFRGMAGLDLWLDGIVQQVSRYNLRPQSFLMLLDGDSRFITIPAWSKIPVDLGKLAGPPETLRGKPLIQALAFSPAAPADLDPLRTLPEPGPSVYETSLNGETCYLATQAVGDLPLRILLILPLVEVYNTATLYGAPLNLDSLPILTQVAVSGIGFIIVMSIGAIVTLRQIAAPIQELDKGANEITNGNLTYRVPVVGRDEMQSLATSFNVMSETIQRKQTELAQALAIRQAEFRAIDEIAALANLAADLPSKLGTILDIVNRAVDSRAGVIYLLDDEDKPVRAAQASRDIPGTVRSAPPETDEELGLVSQVLRRKECVIQGSSTSPSADPRARSAGSAAAVPLEFRERTIGVLVLFHTDPNAFSDQLLTFLEALSTHMAILIENARLQSQARYVLIAEERHRLARELHDSVTQSVFSLSLAAEGLRATLPPAPALDFLIAQADQVRQEMRGLINELRPIDLGSQMLDEAIRDHAASLQRATGLVVTTQIEGEIHDIPLTIQHNLNRILQEALSNVTRHARATQVDVSLVARERAVTLSVQDNGQGFDVTGKKAEQLGSMGLISMQERAEILGGELTIASARGAGTQIKARIPYNQPSQETAHV
jgi:signal transduction histidine kinase